MSTEIVNQHTKYIPSLTPDFYMDLCIKELQKIKCCVPLHLPVKKITGY